MSDFYNKYPYTDFHELNLDWVIARVKKLTEDWLATQEAWNNTQEQWQQLYDYVHDYFTNLDVQDEINNKINQMILDGTFLTIVTPTINQTVVDATTSWLADHITQPTTPAIDTSLSIAGAAADAKVTGDSINELREEVANEINALTSGNYPIVVGYYVDKWGGITADANATMTDFIPVVAGTYVRYSTKIGATAFELAFFDKDQTCMTSESILGTASNVDTVVQVPAGACFAIASGYYYASPCVYTVTEKINDKLFISTETASDEYINEPTLIHSETYYAISPFEPTADASAYESKLVPVNPGDVFTYSTKINSVGYELIMFNEIGMPLPANSIVGRNDLTINTVTIPTGVRYIKLWGYGNTHTLSYITRGTMPELDPAGGFAILNNTGGYYHNGSITADASGLYSDYIKVKKGYIIEYDLSMSSAGDYLTFFNKNKAYIGKVVGGNNNKHRTVYTITDDRCEYIIASSYNYKGTVTVFDSQQTYEMYRRFDVFNGGFDSFSIFRKFCVIGDSLSVGCVNFPDGTSSNRELDYCWGAFIARKYGSECVNCGFTGATAESWLTNPLGLTALQDPDSKSQCYIIALGANELAANIGSPATINDTTTFYGAYKAIYDNVRIQNADAIVFMTTLPTEWGEYEDVNTAVRWLQANIGDGNTFLLDLWTYYQKYWYSQPVAKQQRTHYYPAGYQLMSKIIEYALDFIILDNPNIFAYVPKIDYAV